MISSTEQGWGEKKKHREKNNGGRLNWELNTCVIVPLSRQNVSNKLLIKEMMVSAKQVANKRNDTDIKVAVGNKSVKGTSSKCR